MGNAASHQSQSDPDSPSHPSSPSSGHQNPNGTSSSSSGTLTNGLRDRSSSLSHAFPSSPIKAILHRDRGGNHSHSHSNGGGGGDGTNSGPGSRIQTPAELIDGGHYTPQGLYAIKGPSAWDYNQRIVQSFIIEKKLAPFYRGLEDYEEEWDEEQVIQGLRTVRIAQIQQAKDLKAEEFANIPTASSSAIAGTTASATLSTSLAATTTTAGRSSRLNPASGNGGGVGGGGGMEDWPSGGVTMPTSGQITDKERKEGRAYAGAVECPICFLYYPPNINTSRCCQQPLCTECFVQIKRAEATVTHLESEPAACPYCMEPDLGVIYEVARIARPEVFATSPMSEDLVDPRPHGETMRRKSVNAKSKEVVTTDQIRPDWQEKLNAVKAAAARRASRRIIMHNVNGRLIPVGYTSSRNAGASGGGEGPITMPVDDTAIEALMGRSGRRGRRATGASDPANGPGPNELEEMMIMEAMRLSMIEHEETQRKAEEERKKEQEKSRLKRLSFGAFGGGSSAGTTSAAASTSQNPSSTPTPVLPQQNFSTETSFPDFGVSPDTSDALAEAASTSFLQPPAAHASQTTAPSRPQPGDLIDLSSTTNVPQLKDFSRENRTEA